MPIIKSPAALITTVAVLCTSSTLVAVDWHNAGGNSGRNGLTTAIGPDAPDVLWSGGPSSSIAWQPVIEAGRVFIVRQTGFPPEPNSDESTIYALDLETGDILWEVDLPFESGDWTTWIAGVFGGQVYAARSGNGATSSANLYALDAATGDVIWTSDDEITAGAYDGVVFAPNGDPIIASFTNIKRINATDGSTDWSTQRTCSVSGNCGAASFGDAVYLADAEPGGHVVSRYDLDTGEFEYASEVLPGFTLQNSPFVGPDGTVYLSRTQNNPDTDFFYAFEDDGNALTIKWSTPAEWTTSSEFAAANDGSVYMIAPGQIIERRDADTGMVIASSRPLTGESLTPRMAVDSEGRVFVSNGEFSDGRFYSFNADLTERWSVPVPNINIGAPAIARDGTLIVAGVGTEITAYRTDQPDCAFADLNCDDIIDGSDLGLLLGAFGSDDETADLNNDGEVNGADLGLLLGEWSR